MPGLPQPRFQPGALFIHFERFAEGVVRLQGMVAVDRTARELLLWDADIQPAAGGRLVIEPAKVRRLFAAVCAIAAPEGFDTLVVNGYRISGANPNRDLTLPFVCRSPSTNPFPAKDL